MPAAETSAISANFSIQIVVGNFDDRIRMKKLVTIALVIFSLASIGLSQDDTRKFKYSSKRAFTGTVLHYIKTNIDGTQPEFVSQYFADGDTMESFKFHKGNFPAALVIAKMDWETFSAAALYSHRINSKTERPLFATIRFDRTKRHAEVSIPTMKPEKETFSIPKFPVHIYNFDLGSLNFALPHLVDSKGTFTIGIADPTFRDNAPMAEYKGEVSIRFVAEELRNGNLSRKYSIDGPGLKMRGGHIWVNKQKNWIEDIEIDLPDNPEWKTFKFKLLKAEQMTRPQWEKFILDQF